MSDASTASSEREVVPWRDLAIDETGRLCEDHETTKRRLHGLSLHLKAVDQSETSDGAAKAAGKVANAPEPLPTNPGRRSGAADLPPADTKLPSREGSGRDEDEAIYESYVAEIYSAIMEELCLPPRSAPGAGSATMLLVKNVPLGYTLEQLLRHWLPPDGSVDLVHYPYNMKRQIKRRGVCFLHFSAPGPAARFRAEWDGQPLPRSAPGTPLDVRPAHHAQGLMETLEFYRGSRSSYWMRDDDYLPALFHKGRRIDARAALIEFGLLEAPLPRGAPPTTASSGPSPAAATTCRPPTGRATGTGGRACAAWSHA